MFTRIAHVFGGTDRPAPDICRQIVALGDKYPVADAKIGFRDKGNANENYRRSEIRWIPRTEQQVAGLIWHYINYANRDSFGLDAVWLNDIQLTAYHGTNQDKYDWHQDSFLMAEAPFQRKLSFVMQLSDPSEYEGGEFQFSTNYVKGWNEEKMQAVKAQGTVIVFPSFVLHRVTPVTKGTRRSLVAWVDGPHWR